MKERILRVWSNPFAHVDHEGRPAGAVRKLGSPGGVHEFVGAQLIADVLKRDATGRAIHQDTHFEFSDEPEMIWNDKRDPRAVASFRHYADAVAHGALIPADEATAKYFGMKFVPREEALEAAKSAALDKLKAHGLEDDELPELDAPKVGTRAAKVKAEAERKRRIARGLLPEEPTGVEEAPTGEASTPAAGGTPTPSSDTFFTGELNKPKDAPASSTPPPLPTKPGLVSLAEPQPPKPSASEVSK